MPDGDDLADQRAGIDLERPGHLERAAEGLEGSVGEGALVLGLEHVTLEIDDRFAGVAEVVAHGHHVAEGHVLGDELREARSQRAEDVSTSTG